MTVNVEEIPILRVVGDREHTVSSRTYKKMIKRSMVSAKGLKVDFSGMDLGSTIKAYPGKSPDYEIPYWANPGNYSTSGASSSTSNISWDSIGLNVANVNFGDVSISSD